MSAPLAGIRVADFSELLPGPFMTQALVELGAEVIKIERPPQGDPVRAGSPGLFGTVNRGKRSRMLDLKSETGRTAALELAAGADIVVEGYRPGVMARLGLDYAAVQAVNPRVIYLSLTGYGQDGPLRLVPGIRASACANPITSTRPRVLSVILSSRLPRISASPIKKPKNSVVAAITVMLRMPSG